MAISLQKGVPTAVLGLSGTGAIMMWPTQWGIGAFLLASAAFLLIWGFRINERNWWRHIRFRRLPPTVYLRNTAAKPDHLDEKVFGIKWVEHDLSLTFRGEDYEATNQSPIFEPTLTFELFNAGDESVRHIVARWRLPNVDLTDDVVLLGSNVRSFENGRLKMQSDSGSASIQPVATEAESEPIPILIAGGISELRAPSAFTMAYSIRALGRAKRQSDRQRAADLTDTLAALEQWTEPMDRAFIDLSYVEAGQKRRHTFQFVGRVWGGSPPMVGSYNPEVGSVAYKPAAGIAAVVDHVGVFLDDR